MVIITAQHHSRKPKLRFFAGLNPARGLLEIRDSEDLWQFPRSTIPQNNSSSSSSSKYISKQATNVYKKLLSYIGMFVIYFYYATESCVIILISSNRSKGCSEGTSSIAFEFLIINCQTYFINFFSFNCLTSNFCFSKKYIFQRQRRTTVMGACP